jgi:hypothetical protein
MQCSVALRIPRVDVDFVEGKEEGDYVRAAARGRLVQGEAALLSGFVEVDTGQAREILYETE